MPSHFADKKDITSYDEIRADPSIDDKSGFLDSAVEFLLNQVYPFLVEHFKYVQAADFDHLIFTQHRNQTFWQRAIDMQQKANVRPEHASLYLNQYWALDNELSRRIFNHVEKYLEKNVHILESLIEGESSTAEITTDSFIKIEGLDLELKVSGKSEWQKALKFIKLLNKTRSESKQEKDKDDEDDKDMFRQVILKFQHSNIFGQTIHNTRSSLIVKLCEAGELFPGGAKRTVPQAHFLHYRERFNLHEIKIQSRYISIDSMISWSDLDRMEL